MRNILSTSLLVLLSATVSGQSASEKIDAYLTASEKAGLFSGSALIVEKNNVILNKGYGYKDVLAKTRNDANTIYQLGSITKQFTAAIILKLEEQKKLKIKDRLSKYFPDFPNADRITLEHLLTHTSGVFNITRDTSLSSEKPTNREKIFATLKEKPLDFEPGTNYRYNNSGYVILGYIIEQVTGKRYEQVIREHILIPLQMNNTGFDFKNLKHPDKSVGYNFIADGRGFKSPITDSTFSFSAGALYSTLEDLDKWNQALQNGKVLKKSSLKKAFTPRLAGYGLGWKMDTIAAQPVIAHTGLISGFKSYNIMLPERNTRIIVLSNFSSFNEAKAAKDLISILTDQPYELPKEGNEVKVDESILKQYVGEYQLSSTTNIKIRLENGQLKGQLSGGPELDLFAKSEKDFFLKAADVQIEFVKNEKGEVEKLITYQGGRARTAIKGK